MEGLIKALNIFIKYDKSEYPTSCEHDVLYVFVKPEKVNSQDIIALEKLGFNADEDLECFYSYRYGSA